MNKKDMLEIVCARKVRLLIKNVVFALIPSIALFVLLDYSASYFVRLKGRDEASALPKGQYFEFDPFQMWRLTPGYNDGKISISSRGFRLNDSDFDPNKKLVFLVGGSTAFGLRVGNDETVSYFLEKKLQQYDKNWQVINAGVTGYYSTQELIHIGRNIVRYRPDYVIALTGRNDIFYSLNPAYKHDQIPYHGLIRDYAGSMDPYYERKSSLTPFHVERLVSQLKSGISLPWDREWHQLGLKADKRAIDLFVQNEIAIAAMLAGLNVQYHLFLQPTVNFPRRTMSKTEATYAEEPYLKALNEGYASLVDKADAALDKSWFSGMINLENSDKDLFIDNVHYSRLGAEMVAEKIFQRVFGFVQKGKLQDRTY